MEHKCVINGTNYVAVDHHIRNYMCYATQSWNIKQIAMWCGPIDIKSALLLCFHVKTREVHAIVCCLHLLVGKAFFFFQCPFYQIMFGCFICMVRVFRYFLFSFFSQVIHFFSLSLDSWFFSLKLLSERNMEVR